jgi:AAA family ATP:ADP antiporter
MTKPIRERFDIRAREVAPTLLMSAYFFLVITCFWILKPIKKSLFLRSYKAEPLELLGMVFEGARAEQLAKMLNMAVAAAAAMLFVHVSARFRRERLTYFMGGLVLCAFVYFAQVVDQPSERTIWAFYLFGDLFNMLMVASFFAFQNDISSPALARRTYSTVVLGGVLGGVFGSTFLRVRIGEFQTSTWLWICFAMVLMIIALAWAVGRMRRASEPVESRDEAGTPLLSRFDTRAGMAGAHVVARSPYLLSIVVLVALYELISAVLDFQFSATITHYLDEKSIDQHLATVFMITNWVSLGVQLLATSWVMRKLGIAAALSVLPLTVLAVSSGFVLLPGLWVGSFLSISDNALNYTMNQSAKESLYVPTTAAEKYQAKAFIDVFVQRTAKVVGLVLILVLDGLMAQNFAFVRLLSLFVLLLAFVWLRHARKAGGRFEQMAGAPAE